MLSPGVGSLRAGAGTQWVQNQSLNVFSSGRHTARGTLTVGALGEMARREGAEEKPDHGGGHGRGPGEFPLEKRGCQGLHGETLDHKAVAVDRWMGRLQCQARTQVQALSGAPCDDGSQVTTRMRTAR